MAGKKATVQAMKVLEKRRAHPKDRGAYAPVLEPDRQASLGDYSSLIVQEKIVEETRMYGFLVTRLILSLVIGCLSGAAVFAFESMFEAALSVPLPSFVFFGTLVTVFASALIVLIPEIHGTDIDVLYAAAWKKHYSISPTNAVAKYFATLFTVVVGYGGKIGPLMYVCAGMGTWMSRTLGLGDRDRRVLFISGMAAACSALLHTPIASALIASEILDRSNIRYTYIFPAMISALFGFITFNVLSGTEAVFLEPVHAVTVDISSLWTIIAASVLVGIVGKVLIKFFDLVGYLMETVGTELKPLLGIWIAAMIGLAFGFSWIKPFTIQEIIARPMVASELFTQGGSYVIAIAFIVMSGASVGLVFPSMVFGVFLGKFLAAWLVLNEGMMIVVSLSAILAAMLNIPVAAMVLCIELFGVDATIPAMLGSVIGYEIMKYDVIYETLRE
jgi:CIC family chloride channel protein